MTNVLVNGGFESGLTSWTIVGSPYSLLGWVANTAYKPLNKVRKAGTPTSPDDDYYYMCVQVLDVQATGITHDGLDIISGVSSMTGFTAVEWIQGTGIPADTLIKRVNQAGSILVLSQNVVGSATINLHIAGTSGSEEPVWASHTTVGETFWDNNVQWKCMGKLKPTATLDTGVKYSGAQSLKLQNGVGTATCYVTGLTAGKIYKIYARVKTTAAWANPIYNYSSQNWFSTATTSISSDGGFGLTNNLGIRTNDWFLIHLGDYVAIASDTLITIQFFVNMGDGSTLWIDDMVADEQTPAAANRPTVLFNKDANFNQWSEHQTADVYKTDAVPSGSVPGSPKVQLKVVKNESTRFQMVVQPATNWSTVTWEWDAFTGPGTIPANAMLLQRVTYIDNALQGVHSGSNASNFLITTAWVNGVAGLQFFSVKPGMTVYNLTDGSSGAVTSVTTTTSANDTINMTLSGGSDNKWDTGDQFWIPAIPPWCPMQRNGWIPDALPLEAVSSLTANECSPFYFFLLVPSTAPAGVYTTNLRLKKNGALQSTAVIELTVANTSLANRPTFDFLPAIADSYTDNFETITDALHVRYANFLMDRRMKPVITGPAISTTGHYGSSPAVVTTPIDAIWNALLARGIQPYVTVGQIGLSADWDNPLLGYSDSDIFYYYHFGDANSNGVISVFTNYNWTAFSTDFINHLTAHIQGIKSNLIAKGGTGEFNLQFNDEPQVLYAKTRISDTMIPALIKQIAPLTFIHTSGAPIPEFYSTRDYINQATYLLRDWSDNVEGMKRSSSCGTYPNGWGAPGTPPLHYRMYIWASYLEGFKGLVWYLANGYSVASNPWTNGGRGENICFLYPPRAAVEGEVGPISSTRFEAYSQGVCDVDLFFKLQRLIDSKSKLASVDDLATANAALAAVATAVSHLPTAITSDPRWIVDLGSADRFCTYDLAAIDTIRNNVIDAIVILESYTTAHPQVSGVGHVGAVSGVTNIGSIDGVSN